MFSVNGNPILQSEEYVIEELRRQAALVGVNIFKDIKQSGNDIMVTCPFHKHGQERKPSFGISKSDMRCHCFGGDTKVITKYGTYSIKDLCNKTVEILNGEGDWESVKFYNYGKQNLMKVTLNSDNKVKELYATNKHEWLVKKHKNKVTTDKLKIGYVLKSVVPKKLVDVELDVDGIIHGFCYGDGCLTSYNNSGVYRYRCFLYNEFDKELLKYFINAYCVKDMPAGNGKVYPCIYFKSTRNLKIVPDINESINYLLGFLAGYFAADGNCFKNKLSIYSHKYDDLVKIRDIFTRCGIASSPIGISNIKSGKRGCLYVKQDTRGYTLRIKSNTVPDNFFVTEKGRGAKQKYNRISYRVVSVETTDKFEDVYCCQTSTHSFALEDFILVGNCFTCGYSGNLYDVISRIFGYDDSGDWGKKWLSQNFLSVLVEERKRIDLNLTRNKNIVTNTKFVTEEELDKYRYIHPYMYERGLTDEIIEKFDVGYDKSSNCITFPVLDTSRNCVFVARRSVSYKFFNYPNNVEKPVYGAYLFVGGLYSWAVICESIFNALTCWKWGLPAVALLGTGTISQYKILNNLPVRKYVIATDPDEAGARAAEKLRKNLSRSKVITQYVIPKGKDLNDLDKKVLDLVEIF